MWIPFNQEEFMRDHAQGLTYEQLASKHGGTRDKVKHYLSAFKVKGQVSGVPVSNNDSKTNDYDKVREFMRKNLHQVVTVEEIANAVDLSPAKVRSALDDLQDFGYAIKEEANLVTFGAHQSYTDAFVMPYQNGTKIKFGVVSDCHIGSKYQRLDVLNILYDLFVEEGITQVFLPGNYIDGVARFNKNDLIVHTLHAQTDYFVKNFPQREGITTYFIDGDDHEGWWSQREGLCVGKYVVNHAKEHGRDDLVYLGYMEADVEFPAKQGVTTLRLQHPGGGSAYAISYKSQKIVESLTGGEKPHILLIGHYHKAEYIPYRNIHCVQAGCTCDQTPFMRKNGLAAHVGGWIVEATQFDDGTVGRFKSEWIQGYDRVQHEKWAHKF